MEETKRLSIDAYVGQVLPDAEDKSKLCIELTRANVPTKVLVIPNTYAALACPITPGMTIRASVAMRVDHTWREEEHPSLIEQTMLHCGPIKTLYEKNETD